MKKILQLILVFCLFFPRSFSKGQDLYDFRRNSNTETTAGQDGGIVRLPDPDGLGRKLPDGSANDLTQRELSEVRSGAEGDGGVPSKSSDSESSSPKQDWLILTRDTVKSNFLRFKTVNNQQAFVIAQDELVEEVCLERDLQLALKHNPNLLTDVCRREVGVLLKFHPLSPLGNCIKHGYNSDQCLDAAAKSKVEIAAKQSSAFKSEKNVISDPLALMDEAKNKRFAAVIEAVGPINAVSPTTSNVAKLEQRQQLIAGIESSLVPLLDECATDNNFYLETTQGINRNGIYREKIDQIKLDGNKGTNEDKSENAFSPIPIPLTHVRLLNQNCTDLLKASRTFANNYPPYICAEFGRFSLKCVTSVQNWRRNVVDTVKQLKRERKKKAQKQNRLSSF